MLIFWLSPRKKLHAILFSATIKQASAEVGLSEQSVYSRLRKPDFREKLQVARDNQFQVISNKLEDANFKALDTLINILDDKEVSAGIRVRASQTLLDLSLKNREQADIISRIQNLEEMLKSQE